MVHNPLYARKHMMDLPKKLALKGPPALQDMQRRFNELVDFAASLQTVPSPTVEPTRTAIGTSLKTKSADAPMKAKWG